MSKEQNNQKLVHWADQTAEKIIRERGDLESYTCASGITPSGTVHIGNFREIISVDLVVRALRDRGKRYVLFIHGTITMCSAKYLKICPEKKRCKTICGIPSQWYPTQLAATRLTRVITKWMWSRCCRKSVFIRNFYIRLNGTAAACMPRDEKALQNRDKIKDCLNRYRDDEHKIPATEEYWPVAALLQLQ